MQDGFRRLLEKSCANADIRRVMAQPDGHDPALWRQIVEMGLPGLLVPLRHGGIQAGPAALELLMEEAGAALLPGPFFTSVVLATSLLAACTDEAAKARLLPGLASGARIATVALASPHGRWTLDDVALRAAGGRLDGASSYVFHAALADSILAVAKTADGFGIFEVDPKAPGLSITRLESLDQTLRLFRLDFAGVPATPIAGGAIAVEKMLRVALVALAGEQAGAAKHVFGFTVEYIKQRVQFGRPVGGFQAIKHMAADLLLEVESGISAARHAAQALDADSAEADALVNLAAFACADIFSQVAASAVQMHGGIGFTWEHPCHLYLRRARADAWLFGAPSLYRDRYVTALEKAA